MAKSGNCCQNIINYFVNSIVIFPILFMLGNIANLWGGWSDSVAVLFYTMNQFGYPDLDKSVYLHPPVFYDEQIKKELTLKLIEEYQQVFTDLDVGNKGYLTPQEFDYYIDKDAKINEEEKDRLIRSVDQNKDYKIGFGEFTNYMFKL